MNKDLQHTEINTYFHEETLMLKESGLEITSTEVMINNEAESQILAENVEESVHKQELDEGSVREELDEAGLYEAPAPEQSTYDDPIQNEYLIDESENQLAILLAHNERLDRIENEEDAQITNLIRLPNEFDSESDSELGNAQNKVQQNIPCDSFVLYDECDEYNTDLDFNKNIEEDGATSFSRAILNTPYIQDGFKNDCEIEGTAEITNPTNLENSDLENDDIDKLEIDGQNQEDSLENIFYSSESDTELDEAQMAIEESVKNIVKIVNNSDTILDEDKIKKRKKKKKKKKKKAGEKLTAESETGSHNPVNDENVSYLAAEHDPCDPAYIESEFFHPADRAEQLESLSLEKQLCMLTHMDTVDAAEAIAELDDISARDLIENLDAQDAAKILSAMDKDDAVDVLDDVEEGHRDVLLNSLSPEEALELRTLLTFDPDTAAGVMNTEIIIISDDETVDDAIHHIRLGLEDKDMPYYVYVVDELEKLVGIISLRELMLSRPRTLVHDLISNKRELITAQFDLDKTEVAKLISHYNFLALPVVDRMGHLMGTVTHDDVIDIIQENASSDLLGMVGAGQDEDINTPWTESVRLRLPWLFINMLNSSLSAYIVYLFEGSIAQMAFLAVLMPMVANQAGNTGQQALAVMIRQLATEKFDSKKSWKAVFREGKIGFTTGVIMALCATLIVWGITKNSMLGGIMGASLLLDMLLGSIAGGSIPLVLRALGRDPAQASSIFLTAVTDGAGFFIFLSFASLFVL